MIELRTILSDFLFTLYPRAYFEIAPDDAEFPYIVYDFPNVIADGEGGEIATLDLDGWDMNDTGNTSDIENLMTTINTGLDKKTLTTDNLSITFFLENRMSIIDDNDKRFKRRKYTYSGNLIRR